MNTVRENIILKFIARGKEIIISSPIQYSTNLGVKDMLRCKYIIAPEQRPCMVIWPREETSLNKYGKAARNMTIRIEGHQDIISGEEPSVTGEKMLGDIIKCFSSPDWFNAGSPAPTKYIESIVYTNGDVAVPKDGDLTVGAYADFSVSYFTAIGDPYNL
jgi:hypothetical protein